MSRERRARGFRRGYGRSALGRSRGDRDLARIRLLAHPCGARIGIVDVLTLTEGMPVVVALKTVTVLEVAAIATGILTLVVRLALLRGLVHCIQDAEIAIERDPATRMMAHASAGSSAAP